MTEQINIPANEMSFKEFLFKNKRNRTILILAGVAMVVQFSVFKYFYPFASFIYADSYQYINSAYLNSNINYYPIGYSRFLRIFNVFFRSDFALTAFQYVFIEASGLLFLFSLFYVFKIKRLSQIIIIIFITCNPLFLYISNLVSSDSIFLSLSLIWLTTLMWIINRPSNRAILFHTIIISLAFTVRYNALIYPIISTVAFCLSNLKSNKKVIGIGSGLLLCGLFIVYTSYKYKQLTGIWQFSPFSGWQLANNAMYAYRYVDSSERTPVPEKFKILDQMIRTHYDSTKDIYKYPHEGLLASTFYMWLPNLPLHKYMNTVVYSKDSTSSEFKRWAMMGPLYAQYGKYIIQKYPTHFAKFYLWPNTLKVFTPPVEYLSMYNTNKDTVLESAKDWFGYQSTNITRGMRSLKIKALDFYPILTGISNAFFAISMLCFYILGKHQKGKQFGNSILLIAIFWLINTAFSIFATSGALRFLSFSSIVSSIIGVLLIDSIWQVAIRVEHAKEFIGNKKNINTEIVNKLSSQDLTDVRQ